MRIGLTVGYLIVMLLQGLLVKMELRWWLFQLGFLGTIHLIWWIVLIVKRRVKRAQASLAPNVKNKKSMDKVDIWEVLVMLSGNEISLKEAHNQICSLSCVSVSLLVEIKTLLEQYRDEEMPNWNAPFHYEAEGWASMKYFIQWLERKNNER